MVIPEKEKLPLPSIILQQSPGENCLFVIKLGGGSLLKLLVGALIPKAPIIAQGYNLVAHARKESCLGYLLRRKVE